MLIRGRRQTPLLRSLCAMHGLRIGAALVLVAGVLSVAAGGGASAATLQARIAPRVMQTLEMEQGPAASKLSPSSARYDAKKRLQIDVAFDCGVDAPLAALKAAGMVIGTELHVAPMCVVEGWAAQKTLQSIAAVASVKRIDLPRYAKAPHPMALRTHAKGQPRMLPQTAAGTPVIDGNGISIMNADKYITQTSANGSGITVGVINGDATNLAVIQGRNELPAVNVVQPSAKPTPPSSPSDEGTMMLEEVYAVAPGASLAFCGPQTYTEYVACVQNLIAASVTVITDDLQFPGEDVMTAPAENDATQAIQTLLNASPSVMLFSSAENDQLNYWQGSYNPVKPVSAGTLTCQGQTDQFFEEFTGSTLSNTWSYGEQNASDLLLAWPSTGGTNTSNYDLYVLDKATLGVIACAAGSNTATGTSTNYTTGGTTYDLIDATTLTSLSAGSEYDIVIGTPDQTLSGGFLKLIGAGDGADTWSSLTAGSTTSPQDFATGAYPIGAVDGGDGVGNTIEPFSATGPIQFELPMASTLQAPIVVAPDDIYVDNAGTDFTTDMFSGTSAASPNSAAVAALILSAFPTLTPLQTIGYMQSGAAQLPVGSTTVPNGTYGYGRVDAVGALAAIPAPGIAALSAVSIVGGTSSTIPLTLTGTGTLAVTISSDTTTLIASAAPGITLSPSTCGAPTLACSLVVTPTLGQVGTATLTVSVVDGAKRTASAAFVATVTKPAAPTISITAGASQTLTEGAATTPVTFTVAGTQTLTVAEVSSNTTLLPASGVAVTSGCGGATVLSCTATLTVASGQTGASTLAISVTDPYGQTASGSATVTVNAPSSGGGGGAMDLAALLAMGALLALQLARRSRPGH